MGKYMRATEVVREEYSYTEWDDDLNMSFPRSKIEKTKSQIVINKDCVACFRPYRNEPESETVLELTNGSIVNIDEPFMRFKKRFDID